MRITLLALLLLTSACAVDPAADPAGTPPPPDPSVPVSAVVALLTGVPVVSDGGAVEWCPGQPGADGCAGITVSGLSPGALDRIRDTGQSWSIEGSYDGATLEATGEPEPVERRESDHTTPCTELRGEGAGNMDPTAAAAIAQHVATIPDRFAGQWWDSDAGVMTVLLTGHDVAEHRAALEDAAGDRGTVCVVGGARYSAAELEQAQQRATDIAVDAGMGLWSSGTDAVANRVDLEVERSDEPTRERIQQEAGDAVRVHAFLALRDATLDELPGPPSPGDVELETAQTRGGAGMDALGTFTLRFDAQQGCVHGEFGQEHTGLIWPFGYYAEANPLRVYDQDGQLVAQEGDVLESGGGFSSREGPDRCEASGVWVMNGRPTVVEPSEG
jgi:hypothetical protein